MCIRDRWSVYAADPRARINLGIRRRLAPLLERDRRRVELMNSLLLSMPGTPVLYYGDELGMGDNCLLYTSRCVYETDLNLGVLLGGLGARLRLYARLGCRKATATRVAVFSAVSNWIGYGWVAGAVFASCLLYTSRCV